MVCTLSALCVSKTVGTKLDCLVGNSVRLDLTQSGLNKLAETSCTPIADTVPFITAIIKSAQQVCCCNFKYTLQYDACILADTDDPLVASDICSIQCCSISPEINYTDCC